MKVLASFSIRDRRGMYRFGAAVSLAAFLLLVNPQRSLAQEFRATLTGTVTDTSGAVVPKAEVKAVNVDTGSTYTAESSDAGVYYIPYVVPGTYTVKASAQGFKTAIQDKVLLLAGKYFGQNFTLQVGAIDEKVEVTAAPPMIETANGSGGTILDERTLQNVPVNGRQVYMLIGTTPGSQFTQTQFGPGGNSGTRGWDNTNQYIMGGGVDPTGQDNTGNSGGFNQFTLNGTNITQQISYGNQGAGTWNVSPTLDSVQEVNVMTDTYDARYGRTTGGTVNVVTKNGTNTFHGELVENYKDGSLFDANTTTNVFIAGLRTQQQVENQFGGTVGGPIIKNKVWFFASFEGYRQSIQNTVTGNVPPAYLRPGYNGNTGVDFGLIAGDPANNIAPLDPGGPTDPYVQYGLTLFQPGDSTNSSNPNNAICSPTFSTGGPPSTCGNSTNLVQNVFPFTGGTGNGALIPASMINNTANLMLQAGYVPLPNIGNAENYIGGFGEPANYFAVSPDYYSYNQPMFRVDYDTSDKTKWYSFFGWQKGHERRSNNGLTGLLANGNYTERDSYTASQDMTHMFSPTLLADFKLSLSRFQNSNANGIFTSTKSGSVIGLNITPPPVTNLKDVPEINGILTNANSGDNTIFGNQNDLEASTNVAFDADFTKSKGAHNLHFGGGIFYYTYGNPINGTVTNNANGAFSFTGQWTQFDPLNGNCYQPASLGLTPSASCSGTFAPNGSGWADFLLGLPGNGHVNWNDSLFDYQPVWNLYFQDDWKINHRLTVNLGLRYDVQVGLKERYNELPRGFCETCVNPITTDGVYQGNIASAGNLAAWQAAGINTSALSQVLGTIAPAGQKGNAKSAYDTDWSNIAPRVGFAFAINPKTVVRGGWGLMYGGGLEGGSPIGYQQTTNYLASTDGNADPNQGGAGPGTTSAGPYGVGTPFPASAAYPLGLQPPVGEAGLALAGVGSGGLQVDSSARKIPRTQVMSLGVQREIPGHMALDVHFAGNYTSRLRATLWDNGIITYPQLQYALAQGSSVYSKQVPNPYYGVFSESFPGGCGQSATIQALALLLPWSQYCGNAGSAPPVGIYNAPIGKNWYNGLEVKLTKRTSHGLTLNVAYTWSKNMDGSGYQNGYPYQDANEVHWISQFDRTHVLAVTGVYELPLGTGRTFLSSAPKYLDYAIGGWTVGWSFAAQSGTPLGINNGFNYTCPFASPSGTSSRQWLNPALTTPTCFSSVPHIGGSGFTYNTTPSNTTAVRNYTVPNLDLSLQKSFKITEKISFSLRGEAFNALNSALLGGPDNSPTDGPASLFTNTTTGKSYWTGFGTVSPGQLNFPRNLRVSGKIIF